MMNIRSVSVLVICFISSFASTASFLSWGSSSADDNAQNEEKPQISLSCLLYGDAGCSKTCQLTALLYGCDTKPECRDNLYCFCNEVYHMASGDLTTEDFQKMLFDELWDNTFENTSQANAIRRYLKKNDEMSAMVDTLIRDPRVNGEDIKNQLMSKYPNLSPEFQKLISKKRGMKSDLMTGDHLKYEDILDHFNELVTGIQNSNNELQNIKYRRRIGKILESIQDENELGHLVDLVKLSNNESLYNYVTTVLKKRGYVFDNNENNYVPMMGSPLLYSSGSGDNFHATNVIKEHNLGVNDINEGDMIELSVITNFAQPEDKDILILPSQISTDENNLQSEVRAVQLQIPTAAYTDVETIKIQIPSNAAYTDRILEAQTPNVAYAEVELPVTPPGQGLNAVYAEVNQPINTDMLSLTEAVAKIQADLAALDSEVNQLKSNSLAIDFAGISNMLNSDNFMAPSNADDQFINQSPQLSIDLNSISQVLNNNFQIPQNSPQFNVDMNSISQALDSNFANQQNPNFEDNVSTLMNTLLGTNGIGTPDSSEIDFLNKIPMYMSQVAAAPVTFPNDVTVSKMMSSNFPAATPSAIENSVQYTISKKIRKMQDTDSLPSSGNSLSVVNESPNVITSTTYNSAPKTMTTTVEDILPAQISVTTNESNLVSDEKVDTTKLISVDNISPAQISVTASEPTPVSDGKIDTSKSILTNGNFLDKSTSPQSSAINKFTPSANRQSKSLSETNDNNTYATPSNIPSTKNQMAKKAKIISTNIPKDQVTATAETVMSANTPSNAAAKSTKIMRKTSNSIDNELKNSSTTPTQTLTNVAQILPTRTYKASNSIDNEVKSSPNTTTQTLTNATQNSILSTPSHGNTMSSVDSTVKVNNVKQEVKKIEVPTSSVTQINNVKQEAKKNEVPTTSVIQNASNIKKKKPQLVQNKKDGNQMESSMRSTSTIQTENQVDNSMVGIANLEGQQPIEKSQTTETTQTTTVTQTSTQASTTLEENTNLALEKEKLSAPPPISQESISSFSRYGLDPIMKFANSFKKSAGP